MVQLEAIGPKTLAQHIHKRESPKIADVGKVVDRRPASIHADGVIAHWRKVFHLLRQRVVEAQGHNWKGIFIVPDPWPREVLGEIPFTLSPDISQKNLRVYFVQSKKYRASPVFRKLASGSPIATTG
jgi:hypothetical protein